MPVINPVWLSFMTMTTVGFGDIYPRTHMGRVIGVLVCLGGMILISLLVKLLTGVVDFN